MKRNVLFAIIVSYILIVFGGYVASSESGMGCGPEWPLCNGEVIPVLQGDTLIEFAHRFIGLVLAVAVTMLFFKVKTRESDRRMRNTANWMIVLLFVQIFAGAIVVWFDLPAIAVTVHLLIAMLFLYTLVSIYYGVSFKGEKVVADSSGSDGIRRHLNRLFILILLTMGLGAYIKHKSYALACSWLDCRDTMLPENFPELIQTLHRLVAVLTVIYLFYLVYYAFSRYCTREIRYRLLLAACLGITQIIVGVAAIVTNLPLLWAVTHLAVGTLLYLVIIDTKIRVSLAEPSDKRYPLSRFSS